MQKVVDRDGQVGSLVDQAFLDNQHALIELSNGLRLLVDNSTLETRADGSFYIPYSFTSILRDVQATLVIPLVAEELHVEKEQVEVGKVRIHKHVHERQVQVDEARFREQAEIRRLPINQYVEEAPAIRYEGDTMIIPIVEEVLVVEKRLMLKEEIHIAKHRVMEQAPIEVTLRAESIEIERTGGEHDTLVDAEPVDHLAATRQTNTQG